VDDAGRSVLCRWLPGHLGLLAARAAAAEKDLDPSTGIRWGQCLFVGGGGWGGV